MIKKFRIDSIPYVPLSAQNMDKDQLPQCVRDSPYIDGVDTFYVIRVASTRMMYVGKDSTKTRDGKPEYFVWYRDGSFYSSYGSTIQEAVQKAVRDAWEYIEQGE